MCAKRPTSVAEVLNSHGEDTVAWAKNWINYPGPRSDCYHLLYLATQASLITAAHEWEYILQTTSRLQHSYIQPKLLPAMLQRLAERIVPTGVFSTECTQVRVGEVNEKNFTGFCSSGPELPSPARVNKQCIFLSPSHPYLWDAFEQF